MTIRPFHLAIKVDDLSTARDFYGQLMGCKEGRSSDEWIDFDFFGHQVVVHLSDCQSRDSSANQVDGHDVPVPHFGIVLDMSSWQILAEKLSKAKVDFLIPPTLRFKGKPGEQATMFLRDPAGNALEFKAFRDDKMLFSS